MRSLAAAALGQFRRLSFRRSFLTTARHPAGRIPLRMTRQESAPERMPPPACPKASSGPGARGRPTLWLTLKGTPSSEESIYEQLLQGLAPRNKVYHYAAHLARSYD